MLFSKYLFSILIKKRIAFLNIFFSDLVKGKSRGIWIPNRASTPLSHHSGMNDLSRGELKHPGFWPLEIS